MALPAGLLEDDLRRYLYRVESSPRAHPQSMSLETADWRQQFTAALAGRWAPSV